MKFRLFAAVTPPLCLAFILWRTNHTDYARLVAAMPPAEVRKHIDDLNAYLIPPDGTEQVDIENVYGKLQAQTGRQVKGDGVTNYIQELLPAIGSQEFRAFFGMELKDDTSYRAYINHMCVLKNTKQIGLGNDPRTRRIAEIEEKRVDAENRMVLVDL